MERPLALALGTSLVCHTILLGIALVRLRVGTPPSRAELLEVIYEARVKEQELQGLQSQLADRRASTPVSTAPGSIQAPSPHIRIPTRAAMTVSPMLPSAGAVKHPDMSRPAVVDLTNLVDAAQGDPVLLTYFSAIREQIQKTANRQTWLSGQSAEGVIHVSFILNASGQVQSVAIVSDRSSSSRLLQEASLKIIKASAPFAPFPPSLSEPSKTVVVPLEFVLGSS